MQHEKELTRIPRQTLTRGDVVVSLVYIGEGYNGDFDPDDDQDDPLWRLDVDVKGETVGSVCTLLKVTDPEYITDLAMELAMDTVGVKAARGVSIKWEMEKLSYLNSSIVGREQIEPGYWKKWQKGYW